MDVTRKLARAKTGLVLQAPFYATLLLSLDLVESDAIDTMATDGKSILYAPAFVAEITDAELRGVLAHEVAHVANLHHTRRGGRDATKWNEAADYAINAQLIAEGFALPDGALLNSAYDGMSAEAIYASREGQGSGKSGGAGTPAPGKGGKAPSRPSYGLGGVMDAAPAHDPAALQAAELDAMAKTLQAAQAAKAAGKESALGKRAVDEIKAPAIDWREVLRRYVDSAARHDYAWARPNRRHVASGLYLPGKVKDGMGRLVVVIDTSGSINRKALAVFLGELQGAVDDAAPDVVEVVQCDTQIQARACFTPGDCISVTIRGGGGTNLQPALNDAGDASAVVVFTDCEFPRPPVAIAAPVLWAQWGTGGKAPAWGESLHLPDA